MNECYVVMQEDMGMGVSVIGVYLELEEAEKVSSESGRYWVLKSEINLWDYSL